VYLFDTFFTPPQVDHGFATQRDANRAADLAALLKIIHEHLRNIGKSSLKGAT